MSWKNAKLAEINKQIENLKLIFECRRLYLANYCSELRTIVDLAQYNKIIGCEKDENLKNKIKENWNLMIAFIDSFESECLKKSANNRLGETLTKQVNQTILSIQIKMNDLDHMEDDDLFDKQTEAIDDLIYENIYAIERILFQKKTLFFFESNDTLKDYMNPDTMFGKLIFIRNEHFGKRGIQFLIKYLLILFIQNTNKNKVVLIKIRIKLSPNKFSLSSSSQKFIQNKRYRNPFNFKEDKGSLLSFIASSSSSSILILF